MSCLNTARRPQLSSRAALLLALFLWVQPAAALAGDDAWNAYQRGDYATAAKRYEAAAKQGNRLAQFNYSMMLFRGEAAGNEGDALMWLRQAAEQGLAQAQYNLGLLYEYGKGVPTSQVDATAWFRRAAEQGHTDAQVSLATQYFLGRGAPKDEAEAARWYELAAENGDMGAQYIIAACYEKGYGVKPDPQRAFEWYVRAARQGDVLAREKARELAKRLDSNQK